LDALGAGNAPVAGQVAQLLPSAALDRLVMNSWIPIEVRMQHRREIEARLLLLPPRRKTDAIEALHHRIVRAELVPIAGRKLTQAFDHLEAYLQSHRSLRQRTHECLQRILRLVARFVRMVVGVDATEI